MTHRPGVHARTPGQRRPGSPSELRAYARMAPERIRGHVGVTSPDQLAEGREISSPYFLNSTRSSGGGAMKTIDAGVAFSGIPNHTHPRVRSPSGRFWLTTRGSVPR